MIIIYIYNDSNSNLIFTCAKLCFNSTSYLYIIYLISLLKIISLKCIYNLQ